MKLLQTGDLHLGKTLHETSLIEDQRFILRALKTALAAEDYAALIIAGDIYDRTVPSAEAVALFSEFLVSLRAEQKELDIFIIPGNHDSAQRLAFASPLLGAQRIYIICNPAESFNPIVTGRGNERAAFFLLPFLAPGSLEIAKGKNGDDAERATEEPGERAAAKAGEGAAKGGAGELEFDFSSPAPAAGQKTDKADKPDAILASQAELASEAARRFRLVLAGRKDLRGIPAVLVAHCFALGGAASDSERVFLGSAEQVDPALFSPFAYVALGHLHKTQRVADRIHYAGAPLVYAFDEAGIPKNFLKVELDTAKPDFPVTVTPLPVEPLRRVSRRSGSFDSFYSAPSREPWADHYLEITLTDGEIVANPMNLLKTRYPWLLSVRQEALEKGSLPAGKTDGQPDQVSPAAPAKRNALDDFRAFEESLYGAADADREKLFSELLEECRREA